MARDPTVWLTNLVLSAADLLSPEAKGLTFKASVEGETGTFEIYGVGEEVSPIVATNVWKLYAAVLPTGQLGLMKIAATKESSEALERERFLLVRLQRAVQDENDMRTSLKEAPYPYGYQFPMVIEGFDADGRQALFLGFHESIRNYRQFEPLSRLTKEIRMDLQTAVWLVGKWLQLVDYLYRACDVSIVNIDASNTLVETDKHAVFVFDFIEALENPSEGQHLDDVSAIAKMAWFAVGGDEDHDPPHDAEIMTPEQHKQFVDFLLGMIKSPKPAIDEYNILYDLAERTWGLERKADDTMKRVWHAFKPYPR